MILVQVQVIQKLVDDFADDLDGVVARLVADGVFDEEPTTCDRSCLSHTGVVFFKVRKRVIVYELFENVAWKELSAVARCEY